MIKKLKSLLVVSCTGMMLFSTSVSASEVTTEELLARIEALEERVAALESGGVSVTPGDAKTLSCGLYVAGRDIETGRITIKVTSGEITYSYYEGSEAMESGDPIDWSYLQAADYEDSFNFSDTVTLGLEDGMILKIEESSDEDVSTVVYTAEPFINEQ